MTNGIIKKDIIEVENNKPVPEKNRRGEYYPFGRMKINQSFFIPDGEERKDAFRALSSTVSVANKRYKYIRKFVVRHDEKDGVKGVRVWRVR